MTRAIENRYAWLYDRLKKVIKKAQALEKLHQDEIKKVHPIYRKSAANLIHYLAFRSFSIDKLQSELRALGLPSLTSIEGHVLYSLLNLRRLLAVLLGKKAKLKTVKGPVTITQSTSLLRTNTKLLFGYKSKKRYTRIMVTLPITAADDPAFVRKLLKQGMNCARINCAHDTPEDWAKMIAHVKKESKKMKKKCKIAMDLGGPKLRTGPMIPGPKVIHIKPRRNDLGQVVQPARIWIAPPDILPPPKAEWDAILPVHESLWSKLKRGNYIQLTDTRGKKGKIIIGHHEGEGRWAYCSDSIYLETGMELVVHQLEESGKEISRVGELLPKEQFITLFTGDTLLIHKDPRPGEAAIYTENRQLLQTAHISCTLPEVFRAVQAGEGIFFDDGKIEGVIEAVTPAEIRVKIVQAKGKGSKLKADKGINLPESDLNIRGLTPKDKEDLQFVAQNADAVNFSFVNRPQDVADLQDQLAAYQSKAGIILKIETQEAFAQLPAILLQAMRSYPVGVMIARGDLAIETGWKNFATIQQEILRVCNAAHIPDVWATQVLENLAKKGIPSRAEITDAALAQQAECVMLNKGYYIHQAVKMLDKILRRMQSFQQKTAVVLPKMDEADQLILSHRAFDV